MKSIGIMNPFIFFLYLSLFLCFSLVFFTIFVATGTTKSKSSTNKKERQDNPFDIQACYPTKDTQQAKENRNANDEKNTVKPVFGENFGKFIHSITPLAL